MKKTEKKQAEEFLDLLEQAHSEIRKSLDQKEVPSALSLLADCQEGAISLGNLIEATEGEGFVTISLLEEYCELIYQLHESLVGGESIEAGKVYKLLRNQVIKIRNSVRNDIKVRKEVVFLPYKASMWDSLESVWMAADEDPDCDAYVIPIPYYDKNPDGSFREMHYEGNLYPQYVPVTWYKDYDFAMSRPDIIFIHNPYDEYNYVTSVHPDFYSGKLKEYTDKLVYIPYFVLGEPKLENEESLEEMKHFCTVPGVINADRIIVQSEDMRKAYISILSKAYGEDTRAHWAKKILGIGSPKVDKVLNTRKEDLKIPEEWLKIIQKPDRSWKKIVFYNTSVSALLEHNEKMLEKMRDVLRVFWENRDEVALLWRPHPLIKATISSMRPQLWVAYEKIVEKYREEGWGIYDDTADMDRAVCLSDAYYGDASSVSILFRHIQKSVLIQNPQIKSGKDSFARFGSMLKINEKMLVFSTECNALYEIDLSNGEMRYVESFMDEDFGQTNICCGVIKKGNEIVFFPCFGEKIHILDESDYHEIRNISFRSQKDYRKALFFAGEYENNVYLITYDMLSMYKYDINTHTVKKINLDIKKMDDFFPRSAVIREGKIYVAGKKYPFVVCIDLILEKATIQKVQGEESGFEGIIVEDNSMHLLPVEKAYIISYANQGIKYHVIREPIREMAGCIIKDNCWMIGNNGGKELIVFDYNRKQVTYKTIPEEFYRGNQANRDNHYCLMYGKNHFAYYVDDDMERIMQLSLKSESALLMFENFTLNSNSALCEINEGISLSALLGYLAHNFKYNESGKLTALCGEKIYQEVV